MSDDETNAISPGWIILIIIGVLGVIWIIWYVKFRKAKDYTVFIPDEISQQSIMKEKEQEDDDYDLRDLYEKSYPNQEIDFATFVGKVRDQYVLIELEKYKE